MTTQTQQKALPHPEIANDQSKALQMQRDGFTLEQIAHEMGHSVDHVQTLLETTYELGSPEQIMQESLRRLVDLIPVAEQAYRDKHTLGNANVLTSFISTAEELISNMYSLKEGEETFKTIIAKVLQPFCRNMIHSLLTEVQTLNQTDMSGIKNEEQLKEKLTNLSRSVGISFKEHYREATEELANVLGVSAEERARILSRDTFGKGN